MHIDYDDYDDDYGLDAYAPEPPLYRTGQLADMTPDQLQKEWQRQCNIHDSGVDNLPMGHPTIEDAAARVRCVEAEQKRRGLEEGPGAAWFGDEE